MMDMKENLAQKCADCHLFVEENEVELTLVRIPLTRVADYVHLRRGDDADEAIEATHQAKPSGMIATIGTWQRFGPQAMRHRFLPDGFDPITDEPDPDIIGVFLLHCQALVAAKTAGRDKSVLRPLIDQLYEQVSLTSVLFNMDRSGTLSNIDELIRLATELSRLDIDRDDYLAAIDDLAAELTKIGGDES